MSKSFYISWARFPVCRNGEKELYENMDICRDVFNIANEKLGFKISELCFEGPIDELNITENTQPAILTVNIACLKALRILWDKG